MRRATLLIAVLLLPTLLYAQDRGTRHALVIGNGDYQHLDKVATALADAKAVAQLLQERYGFEVTLLQNATRGEIVSALANYRSSLEFTNSLLVYFSGRGHLDGTGQGYWIPVEAEGKDRSLWLSNATITSELREIRANHVMVVSDSCYSGWRSRTPPATLGEANSLESLASKRARVVLVSGELEPRADVGRGGGHSLFANAFLDALASSPKALSGDALLLELRSRLSLHPPSYGNISECDPGGGDFFFLRNRPLSPPPVQLIAGFKHLRQETFSLGGQEHTVAIYRSATFAEALGLVAGQSDPACEFVLLPGGAFNMGSPEAEAERDPDESPQHQVTLKPFLLARTEITQAVWQKVMGNDPSRFKGARRPVELVSWNDASAFCKKAGLRLPSESEWEYACRAGTITPFAFGPTITSQQSNLNGKRPYANASRGCFRQQTTEVGRFPPNSFGLFDMHGNVWEWCQDAYRKSYTGAPRDGSAWEAASGSKRVRRGGSWAHGTSYSRSASRSKKDPYSCHDYLGFRPVRSP